ncbi:hypothetical protein COCMIDRAFT_100903 [Bipolaris oryzae ATCC 44560]|uniref:Uncharacterized protein n=1 Tax=Bipolaris oryzae ATCC 44560 TaxID=930090 RepID=W6Z0E0_COCMI|nr:uncharacterized protein COCMIDRAFT_100903 [Bipolaris oryzae ATCC 44560]EUC43395.1 hypothetical protein COCMIDRAFT_100903 [Bipolaris oryzae ATCC 44560]
MPTSPQTHPLLTRDHYETKNTLSIFHDDSQKRGFIIVIVLSVFATVGMLALIFLLVFLKKKRDRRNKAAKMDAEKGSIWPGTKKGKYQKVEDEDQRDGVWSADMELDERGAYSGAGYGEGVGKEPYRPADSHASK